jgi:hypothetical protein
MVEQALLGRHLLLATVRIVGVDLGQDLDHVAARLRKMRDHVDDLASSVGQAFADDRRELADEVARQRIAHLHRWRQRRVPLRQDIRQVLPGMRMAGEIQRHVLPLSEHGDDAGGVDGLGLGRQTGGFELVPGDDQRQNLRPGVVAVQQIALSGLADQFAEDGARRRHGLDHEVPLGGIRQRHVETRLQPLDAVERQTAAVTQQGEQARTTGVVLRRAGALGQRRGEGRIAQPAAQMLPLVDRGPHRRLSDDLDDGLGRRVIDLAGEALRTGVAGFQIGNGHFDDRGVAILRGAVAAVALLRLGFAGGLHGSPATPLPPLMPAEPMPDSSAAAGFSSEWAVGKQLVFALGRRAKQPLAKARQRRLRVLQGLHDEDKGGEHLAEQLVLRRRERWLASASSSSSFACVAWTCSGGFVTRPATAAGESP